MRVTLYFLLYIGKLNSKNNKVCYENWLFNLFVLVKNWPGYTKGSLWTSPKSLQGFQWNLAESKVLPPSRQKGKISWVHEVWNYLKGYTVKVEIFAWGLIFAFFTILPSSWKFPLCKNKARVTLLKRKYCIRLWICPVLFSLYGDLRLICPGLNSPALQVSCIIIYE